MMRSANAVVVVGGGAAGLMAALFAARGGAHTVLLEGSRQCGLKILISGGGRCNVLPAGATVDDFYTSGSRNVLRRIFRTWPLSEVREFFESELGIPLVLEEETGKLFPVEQRSKPVRDRLVGAVADAGARVEEGWRVRAVERARDGAYRITRDTGEVLSADRVILATGGQSLPKTGSDGAGYALAEQLGHALLPRYPALVPLMTADEELRELAGMTLRVRWRATRAGSVLEERDRSFLFTHRGFSGPAVLDASHWVVRDGADLEVSWGALPAAHWEARWGREGGREAASIIADELPRRLARLLCARALVTETKRAAQLTRAERDRLLEVLCRFRLPVSGNEGYRVAEVTGGGVALGDVNPSTLESRCSTGLYPCGEILDVIGRIGGYNFLFAWVTGRLAGESAAAAPPNAGALRA